VYYSCTAAALHLAESREKCRAVLGSPGIQRLVAVKHGLVKTLVLAAVVARERISRPLT
jgi:hypothetical protein